MPTFRHGRLAYFAIEQLDSTYVDVSNVLKQINFPVTVDTPETTAFGSTFKSYVVGIKDAKFNCQGMFDATVDGYFQSIYGQSGPTSGADSALAGFGFRYSPEAGTTPLTAGITKYTGRVHLVTYTTNAGVAEMVGLQCDFVVTSAVSRGTGTTWP